MWLSDSSFVSDPILAALPQPGALVAKRKGTWLESQAEKRPAHSGF